ncbi:hypothetical protein CVT26_006440 [Gymnopilus dilepis]|uniref:Uncharacterized protein n=1 Tax=Gymnopilus dilepis TaxID=231916 RepID=A0A409Y1U0_9AGAR|nr:hypothetical protein CVT26_006440 [Gymnopilus dilepis]
MTTAETRGSKPSRVVEEESDKKRASLALIELCLLVIQYLDSNTMQENRTSDATLLLIANELYFLDDQACLESQVASSRKKAARSASR